MKRMLVCLLLLPLSTVLLSSVCHAKGTTSSATSAKKVVAKVNDLVITEAELDREVAMVKQRMEARGRAVTSAQLKDLRGRVLDRLVQRDLLYGVCLKDGIKVDKSETEKTYQMIKARYANDAAFKKVLQRSNFTEAEVKQDIARELAIKKLIDSRFLKKIKVTDNEAKAYYEKNKAMFKQPASVKASHILIKVAQDAKPAVKAKAKARIEVIKKKIENGADFAAMAKKYSEGPSAARGGDLGYFHRGQMVKPFEDAAFALKPGEMSDVVETRFGYHLIKLIDKKEASVVPFEQLKDRIVTYLKRKKLQKAVSSFLDGVRAKSTIEISKAGQTK